METTHHSSEELKDLLEKFSIEEHDGLAFLGNGKLVRPTSVLLNIEQSTPSISVIYSDQPAQS